MIFGLLVLLACTSPEATTDDSPTDGTTPDPGGRHADRFDALGIESSSLLPTVFQASWTTLDNHPSWVEVTDTLGTWSTPEQPQSTSHRHTLIGLKAGHPVSVVAAYRDAAGETVRAEAIELEVPAAPPELTSFVTTRPVAEQGLPERFWVLTYYIHGERSHAVILDQDGDPVWWLHSVDPARLVIMARPSRDGASILTAHFNQPDQGIRRTPLGAMSDLDQTFTPTVAAHHDMVDLPDGRIAYLGHDDVEMEWGPWGTVTVQVDVIREVDEGTSSADEAMVRFHPLDLPVPLEPVCEHAEAVSTADEGLRAQWAHSNSLLWDETDDSFMVNHRNLDALSKIDRWTGERLWALGGAHNEFTATSSDLWFDHGHMSHWTPTGFTMFSNELHHGGSRLMHYAVDQDARTLDHVWSYPHPTGHQSPVLGDVDPTPDGAYLAAWGDLSRLQRITAAGEISWQAEATPAVTVARASWLTTLYP